MTHNSTSGLVSIWKYRTGLWDPKRVHNILLYGIIPVPLVIQPLCTGGRTTSISLGWADAQIFQNLTPWGYKQIFNGNKGTNLWCGTLTEATIERTMRPCLLFTYIDTPMLEGVGCWWWGMGMHFILFYHFPVRGGGQIGCHIRAGPLWGLTPLGSTIPIQTTIHIFSLTLKYPVILIFWTTIFFFVNLNIE